MAFKIYSRATGSWKVWGFPTVDPPQYQLVNPKPCFRYKNLGHECSFVVLAFSWLLVLRVDEILCRQDPGDND